MKAAVYRRYGGPEVVEITDMPDPSYGTRDLLVRVRATTVSAADWRFRSATAPRGMSLLMRLYTGLFRPRRPVLGVLLAGVVEAVGPEVSEFTVGDRVVANVGAGLGCHAELRAVSADGAIAKLPESVSDAQAAALVFGGSTALHYLRDAARVQPGERVLVVGGSGAVGSAMLQVARHLGAHATGVASAANRELVESLGADAIAYEERDFTTASQRYDVIVDTIGAHPYARCAPVMTEGGRLVRVLADLAGLIGAALRPRRGSHRIIGGVAPERAEDLVELVALTAAGIFQPVIDSVVPFAEIAAAHARVDTGRKRGSVVVQMPA